MSRAIHGRFPRVHLPLLRRKTSISAVMRYGSAVSCVVSRPFRPTTHSLLNHHCVQISLRERRVVTSLRVCMWLLELQCGFFFPPDGVMGTTFDN